MIFLLDVILSCCDYQGRMSRNSEDDLCIFRRFHYVVARRALSLPDEATSSFIEKIASGED